MFTAQTFAVYNKCIYAILYFVCIGDKYMLYYA